MTFGVPFSRFNFMVLAALAGVVIWAPLSVRAAAWVDYLDPLPWLALGGLVVGFLLARVHMWAVLAHLVGVGLGLEAVVYVFAGVPRTGTLAERVDWLAGHVAQWGQVVWSGGASTDPLVFALVMAALAWLLGYTSAWMLFRGNAPWPALVSNALPLLMNLSYAPRTLAEYLAPFLFASLLLLAVHQLAQRHELWRLAQMPVEPQVASKTVFGSAILAATLLWAAWALPAGVIQPSVATGWDRVTTPWRELERDFDRMFASLNSAGGTGRDLSFGRTLAPRGSFELSDTPVLLVQSPVPRYWRATTADRYTGHAITSSETNTVPVAAEDNLLQDDQRPDERMEVQAKVKVLANHSAVAFVPDAPLRLSVPAQVDIRGESQDVAAIRLDTPLQRNQEYTVSSAVSQATSQQLRTAGQDYPGWVRERYLQRPRDLPGRVAERAREVTANAFTPYDKAVAIEAYLRDSFTYSTRVPAVPPDRDWVDFLLFDSPKGYCDYFATAMTVMLRTAGIPARVASGFAPGDFDAGSGTWLIRENHAHSWVEVYFPRYGWVTFEPSAIRPVPARVEGSSSTPSTAEARGNSGIRRQLTFDEFGELGNLEGGAGAGVATRVAVTNWAAIGTAAAGLLAALGALCCLVGIIAWRRGMARLAWYQRPYAQLLQLARWLGAVKPTASHTPYESADLLVREVPQAESTIRELTNAYVQGTYAARPLAADPRPTWDAARGQFARLVAVRRARRLLRRVFRRSGSASTR
jgi:transglutaminase-like putative cysteine protease